MATHETTPGGCLLGCALMIVSAFVVAAAIGAGLRIGLGL